jgi:hypothetical protein
MKDYPTGHFQDVLSNGLIMAIEENIEGIGEFL